MSTFFSVIEITEADLIVNTGIALSFRQALENIKEKMIAIDRNMDLPRMSPFYYLGMVISGNEAVRIPLGDVLGKFYIGKGSFTNYVYRFLAFFYPPSPWLKALLNKICHLYLVTLTFHNPSSPIALSVVCE